MLKEFSPFAAPFQIFKGDLYRDVATRWGGIGFLYLFTLVVVVVSLQTVRSTIEVASGLSQNQKSIEEGFKDLPTIEVKDGLIKIDKPSPYVFRGGSTTPVVVFDTSGSLRNLSDAENFLKRSQNPDDHVPNMPQMLVTTDTVFMRQDTGEMKELSAKQLQNMTFSRELVSEIMKQLPLWWALLCIVGTIFCVVPTHLFIALVYAVCGLIMCSATGAKLSFGACMRLAVIAMTPSIILSGLLGVVSGGVLGALYPFCPILNFASIPVTLGFLYFAAASCTAEKLQS